MRRARIPLHAFLARTHRALATPLYACRRWCSLAEAAPQTHCTDIGGEIASKEAGAEVRTEGHGADRRTMLCAARAAAGRRPFRRIAAPYPSSPTTAGARPPPRAQNRDSCSAAAMHAAPRMRAPSYSATEAAPSPPRLCCRRRPSCPSVSQSVSSTS